jgi:hypothetical protein
LFSNLLWEFHQRAERRRFFLESRVKGKKKDALEKGDGVVGIDEGAQVRRALLPPMLFKLFDPASGESCEFEALTK